MSQKSVLEQIQQVTTVVVDTGDLDKIKQYRPQDATTNPSLVLKAVRSNHQVVRTFVEEAQRHNINDAQSQMEWVMVSLGKRILDLIPGRVSTEVEAMFSFDREATVQTARRLMSYYVELGVDPKRILIKIAATWEGIQAAKQLEQEGIHCNMTLIFSPVQAIACAEAGATLISPFVGRILDWHIAEDPNGQYVGDQDPGVQSVKEIYTYFKQRQYKTQVMGASFRNMSEIQALAGCDLLTISPDLLKECSESTSHTPVVLSESIANNSLPLPAVDVSEVSFRWLMNENPMATEKLSEGIRVFAKDGQTLRDCISSL